jgi:hypothetical protein
MNSPVIISRNIRNDNLRYIIWYKKNGEIPGILDISDLGCMQNPRFFFARKFDGEVSKELIKKICI